MRYLLKAMALLLVFISVRLLVRAPGGAGDNFARAFPLTLAGVLLFFFSESGEGRRGKTLKLISAVFFFILGIAGLFTAIFALLGGLPADFLYAGTIACAAGLAGVARSIWGQAGDEALDMAPQFGFSAIEEDSDYAAQGMMSGVLTAFNLVYLSSWRSRYSRSCLSVACGIPNIAGLALYAFRGGAGARPLKPLPPAISPAPEHWEDFSVYCSRDGADMAWFSALRSGEESVFSDLYGLESLEITEKLLKAEFVSHEGLPSSETVGLILGLVAKAASSLP